MRPGPLMTSRSARIHAIHRYPVKGLTPEPLREIMLSVAQTLPCDRMYAIENGPSGFDSAEPRYLPIAAVPDADAQRPPRRTANRFRRSEPHPDDPL